MAERLVREQSPAEFFKEQVDRALEHQKVSTSAFTEVYLVNLLTGCLHADALPAPEPGYDEMPLALLYLRALQAERYERMRLLRAMGDTALFTSGFFADSLSGKLADLAYYRALGGRAYACLSQEDAPNALGASVFSELAGRFGEFADVLSEVSESTRLSTHKSILDLYERWMQTGSRRAALLLAERGITPVVGGESGPQ
ncbi:MAG TPA: hypothetical protein VGQ78_04660 [Vicinamibacteria bacterium]|nr:hypothetical protein [Vicinamibacteria bacterium]